MVVLVPFDGGEADGVSSTAAPDPFPVDGNGDGDRRDRGGEGESGDRRDRGGEGDSAGHISGDGDNAALVHAAGDGGGGRDRLSDLSNDLLACILAGLRDTHAAATTNVLSRRWHRVWTPPLLNRLCPSSKPSLPNPASSNPNAMVVLVPFDGAKQMAVAPRPPPIPFP
uniref:F-box domain-containing protein n=1 Tax=Oryza brachyantha TaxID=4533 RepID=J3MLU4_ORYBR